MPVNYSTAGLPCRNQVLFSTKLGQLTKQYKDDILLLPLVQPEEVRVHSTVLAFKQVLPLMMNPPKLCSLRK